MTDVFTFMDMLPPMPPPAAMASATAATPIAIADPYPHAHLDPDGRFSNPYVDCVLGR